MQHHSGTHLFLGGHFSPLLLPSSTHSLPPFFFTPAALSHSIIRYLMFNHVFKELCSFNYSYSKCDEVPQGGSAGTYVTPNCHGNPCHTLLVTHHTRPPGTRGEGTAVRVHARVQLRELILSKAHNATHSWRGTHTYGAFIGLVSMLTLRWDPG